MEQRVLLFQYDHLEKLCLSITLTGDGTFDQPYKVVHISDEYEILFSLLGATSIVTQGVASGATIMDRITYTIKSATTDPATNEQQLEQQDAYFDIELPMAYLQKMFFGGEVKSDEKN